MMSEEQRDSFLNLSNSVHLLKRPLFFWAKSFDNCDQTSDLKQRDNETLTKFLNSNTLNSVLEYIGLQVNEHEPSSLNLSTIFDEENSISFTGQSSSLTSNNSSRGTTSKISDVLRTRISSLNNTFSQLKSYYEVSLSQLLVLRPPNSLHISTACSHCSLQELEKILLLALGAAVQGGQKQDAIRKIKGLPTDVQESLVEAIKEIKRNPEVVEIVLWEDFLSLEIVEQRKVYEGLLTHLRRLVYERNDSVQSQCLMDFYSGFTNCEQKRDYESRNFDSLEYFEKFADDSRVSAALRQLREQLSEKSDLLQECLEELEATKSSLQDLQVELSDKHHELKSCKKARDEFDVLREGQERAVRLEAEVLKMKKKLEESEQYYERVEILENENRNYQRKQAVLMDKINMLQVEKERLEVSFMTHSQNHSLNMSSSHDTFSDSLLFQTSKLDSHSHSEFEEQLLLESDDETTTGTPTPNLNTKEMISENNNVNEGSESLEKELLSAIEKQEISIPTPVVVIECIDKEALEVELLNEESIDLNKDNESLVSENVQILEAHGSSVVEELNISGDSNKELLIERDISSVSEKGTETEESSSINRTEEDAVVPEELEMNEINEKEKVRSKRIHHRHPRINLKRTKKSLFGLTKVVLQKVTSLTGNEENSNFEPTPPSSPKKISSRRHRSHSHRKRQPTPTREQSVPDIGEEADEELSISPSCVPDSSSSSSGSDLDILNRFHSTPQQQDHPTHFQNAQFQNSPIKSLPSLARTVKINNLRPTQNVYDIEVRLKHTNSHILTLNPRKEEVELEPLNNYNRGSQSHRVESFSESEEEEPSVWYEYGCV